jgi:hypothetical protein
MIRRLAAGALGVALMSSVLLAGLPATAAAHPPSSFMTGFSDGIYEASSNPNPWLRRTVATGARLVLLGVNWAGIAPGRPRGNAANPANPSYHWGTLDQTVRAALAHHLTVAFSVASSGGPEWVDGPHKPSTAVAGTWNPNIRAFAAFARAVAVRFSGHYRPPGEPRALPRVRYYQAWGEPNLPDHLSPQWVRTGGRWVAKSPFIYRGLLNGFYNSVKSVHSSNQVITAGTAPYGDPPGWGARMPPALFVRDLLCVTRKLRPTKCPHRAHFDILAHHPYDFAGPFQKALNPDDVSLPDMWKLIRPLKAAERHGLVVPRGNKPVWITEFSWDSRPPDPHGIPSIKRAYWIEETFHELWHEGVSAIAWYLIADQPPIPNYASSYQSGIYFLNGHVKPGLEGFRLPFVVFHAGRGYTLWGISPRRGSVLVEERVRNHWRTLYHLRVRAHAIFARTFRARGHPVLRAVIGRDISLTWRVH